MTKEQKCWKLIEDAKWTLDHDYERIAHSWSELPAKEFKQLETFINERHFELSDKFHDAWLGQDGGEGIPASDDSWSDLLAEVIGRGERFYNNITKEQLTNMAQNFDYEESFLYCLNLDLY